MIKFRYVGILTLSSLLIFSSAKAASNNQFNTSLVAMNASTVSSSNQAKLLVKSGKFVSGEHPTQGAVHISTKEGKSFIELEQSFKTSTSGPDLVVILHRSNNVITSTKPPSYPIKKGDFVIIAPLKKYSGAQTYQIPNNINLADYKSVAIWCRRFNATFGAANLSE